MKINRTILLTLSLLAIAVSSVQSQEVIDYASFRASYQFLSKTNVNQEDFQRHDLIFVDIGNKVTKSYSRFQQRRDSVTRDAFIQGLSAEKIRETRQNYRQGCAFSFHHWFHKSRTVVTARLVAHDFIFEDEIMMPQWTITGEEKVILGYPSIRAIANYRGREWIAYFTPEIPISRGPWLLWGLPGLIVKAYDSENLFRFELVGFEQVANIPIVLNCTSNNGNRFREVSKAEFIRLEKVLYDDFLAFAELMTGRPLVMERRPERVNSDYIPIEPW